MTEPWTVEWREQQLQECWSQWSTCERCELCKTRKNVVFGSGNPSADVLLCGEAPGENEDETGEPFAPKADNRMNSGDLLNLMLDGISVRREDLFITNLIGCRPPGNRAPTPTEKAACAERLHRIIYLIDPLLIIAVGAEALQYLMRDRGLAISKVHGRLWSPGVQIPGRIFPKQGDDKKSSWNLTYDMVAIYHPAYLLRIDPYNPETQSFKPSGETASTFRDLEMAFDYANKLRRLYNTVRR